MRPWIALMAVAALVTGCKPSSESNASSAAIGEPETLVPRASPEAEAGSSHSASANPALGDRTGEITNPDDAAMVLLYHNLAGLEVPVDRWAEEDSAVRFAPAIDRAAARESTKAKIRAGTAAAAGVGRIRLTMDANLSDFDPSYNEFTVRALAPSSVVNFESFGERVGLQFGNAQKAQRWSLAAKDAQAARDRIENTRSVLLDVLLRVTGAQPAPGGGTINADVVEYELRNRSSGTTIARVSVE